MNEAILYVVATPIGNREDITLRALRVLGEVDLIAAEDTRRAGQLLKALGIGPQKLISYYDAIEKERAPQIVERMESQGLKVALISDAGTPGVADPGYRLVLAARRAGIKVVAIPGVSALATIVSIAGLPSNRVLFVGFLPSKAAPLRVEVQSWARANASIVCYETARRMSRSLAIIAAIYPAAQVCIGRELTKVYEETLLVGIAQAMAWCAEHSSLKGELALMIHLGAQPDEAVVRDVDWHDLIAEKLQEGLSTKDIVAVLSPQLVKKSVAYQEILRVKKEMEGGLLH